VSISGMIAISLFTLYLLDELGGKVKSLETTWKEWTSLKTQSGPPTESKITDQALANLERKMEQSHQSLKERVEDVAAKTNSLREEMAGLNQNIRSLTDSISENKGMAESLRAEISSVKKKYDEIEKMLTEIVRKLLQSRA
jgi:chromosome segregation ATPase